MLSSLSVRRCGLLGLVGGITFAPYAASKSTIATVVLERGLSTPVTTAAGTAYLVHLVEALPLLLLLVGLLGYAAAKRRSIGSIGRLGVGVIVVGTIAVVLTHYLEHTLPTVSVVALPGDGGVFEYGYLLSWIVLQGGQSLLGIDVMRGDGYVTPASGALAATLPVAVIVGLAVVVTGSYTLAGTHRLVQAAVGAIVGHSLWSSRARPDPVGVTARL